MRESTVFHAQVISTPLLIVHNKEDAAVPWNQGLELFLALRRLGKRVWMIQYDGENRGVFNRENSIDYTLRLTQFFDYYLKGDMPPKWMTEGIPQKLKGRDSGLETDFSGRLP